MNFLEKYYCPTNFIRPEVTEGTINFINKVKVYQQEFEKLILPIVVQKFNIESKNENL